MKNNKMKMKKTEAELSQPLNCKEENIFSDVNGSYTGVPIDGGEPVQDADDL